MEFFYFWIMKALAEAAIGVAIFFALFLLIVISQLPYVFRQMRCKHACGVHETQACDAICRECGKNLGFIGDWRRRKVVGPVV
jgi:hypothetical protein